eukprot:TRINITY_DN5161_c0_g2_i1.p1 TRINITY_DN5161_c0_g2~~TRINITY_DN5161_c0_g2_i1.p1  ORF type:complete len:581 (-),score=74.84 TRINITY_DN5161_c0_g2_i1:25-1647(-)
MYITKYWHYNFTFPLFNYKFDILNVEPLTMHNFQILHIILMMASFLVVVGLLYRVAILTLFSGYLYVFLLEKANYSDFHYLLLLGLFLLLLVDANVAYSLDNMLYYRNKETLVPVWQLRLFQFQFAIIVFYTGVSKLLNVDWINRAEPLKTLIFTGSIDNPYPLLPLYFSIEQENILSYILSYVLILTELLAPMLLGSKLNFACIIIINFWGLANMNFGDISRTKFYTVLLLGVNCLWNGAMFSFLFTIGNKVASLCKFEYKGIKGYKNSLWKLLPLLLGLFLVLSQISLPLRPIISEQSTGIDSDWTGQDYMFSWREHINLQGMILRYEIMNDQQERTYMYSSKNQKLLRLTDNQRLKTKFDPNLSIQFIDKYIVPLMEKGFQKKMNSITIDSWKSVNGRPYQRYINSSLNFYQEDIEHTDLILPTIPEVNTIEWLKYLNEFKEDLANDQREVLFFADTPGNTFQAMLKQNTVFFGIVLLKGEVEVDTSEPLQFKPEIGEYEELPWDFWHSIHTVGDEPSCWAYVFTYPSSGSFEESFR